MTENNDQSDYYLIGIGHPLLDISVNVKQELLDCYDLKSNDAVLCQKHHGDLIERLVHEYKSDLKLVAGGAVQNTIRTAQWVFNSLNLKKTLFLGTVGNDGFASLLEEQVKQDNVKPLYVKLDTEHDINENLDKENKLHLNNLNTINLDKEHKLSSNRTGICIALNTNDGLCRSMVTYLNAAQMLNARQIELNISKIQNVNLIYCSGFLLPSSFDAVLKLIDYSVQFNKKFTFNLSAPFICEKHGDYICEIFSNIDILFGNLEEFQTFAKFNQIKTSDIEGIINGLFDKFKYEKIEQLVLVTENSNCVLLFQRSTRTCSKFDVPKVEKNKILDTIGAGDAFTGGFLAYYLLNKSLDLCVKCGIYCARQIICVKGCNFDVDHNFQIEDMNKLFHEFKL